MYKTKNFLYEIILKILNYRIADGILSYGPEIFDINLGLSYSYFHLHAQATVFTKELLSRSSINYRYIFGARNYEEAYKRCFETYIYSYAVSLLYGMNYHFSSGYPSFTNVFVGHGILSRLIARESFVIERDDISINVTLRLKEVEKNFIRINIFQDYPWLKEFDTIGIDSKFSFTSSQHNRYLSNLLDHCNNTTDSKSYVSYDRDGVFGNVVATDQPDSYSHEKSDTTTGDSRKDPKKGNDRVVSQGMRLMEIYPLDSPELDNFITSDNLPLPNSCLNLKDPNTWYYIYSPTESIKFSINSFLPRGLFIYLRDCGDSKNPNSIGRLANLYELLPRSFATDAFIPRDVRAITYLNVSRGVSASDYPSAQSINLRAKFTNVNQDILTLNTEDPKDPINTYKFADGKLKSA